MTAAIPDGPLDRRPDGYATADERETLLRQLLADANVRLGAYDEVTVRWLVNALDWWTFAGVTSLIKRAAVSEPPKCRAGCGKSLRSEASIARGYGRRCWEKLHGRTLRPARIRTSRSPDQMPGQTEIELMPYQATLWSL